MSRSYLRYSGLCKGTYVWMFSHAPCEAQDVPCASETLSASSNAAKGRAETRAMSSRKTFDLFTSIISSTATEI